MAFRLDSPLSPFHILYLELIFGAVSFSLKENLVLIIGFLNTLS